MKESKQAEPLCEFGIRPEDAQAYIVERSFYLPIRYGPLVSIPKGECVWLSKKTGDELFYCGKVIPKTLSEFFKVIRSFRHVKNDEWIDLKANDILRLTKGEAVDLLRKRMVIETEEVESDEV